MLRLQVRARDDKCQQLTLKSMFAGRAQKQQQQAATAVPGGVADLEDFGGGGGGCKGGSSKGKGAAGGQQQLGRARLIAVDGEAQGPEEGGEGQDADVAPQSDQQQQLQPPEPPEPKPDWQQDYVGWLRVQKRKWAAERQERKRQKVAAARRQARRPAGGDRDDHGDEGDEGAAPGGAAGNLGAYLRQQAKAVSRSTWQVLQVAPTRSPGEYRLWVVADGGLYGVPLRVPRRLVVNSSCAPGDPGAEVLGEPTKALLPAADAPLHLYEVRGRRGQRGGGSQGERVARAREAGEGGIGRGAGGLKSGGARVWAELV